MDIQERPRLCLLGASKLNHSTWYQVALQNSTCQQIVVLGRPIAWVSLVRRNSRRRGVWRYDIRLWSPRPLSHGLRNRDYWTNAEFGGHQNTLRDQISTSCSSLVEDRSLLPFCWRGFSQHLRNVVKWSRHIIGIVQADRHDCPLLAVETCRWMAQHSSLESSVRG